MFQTLADEFVKYPTKDSEIRKIKEGFYRYGGFPAAIGAIYGTQIPTHKTAN